MGHLHISPSTREAICGERRQILEPRIMQVLVALRGGNVMSRDDLIAQCWEGRIVGNDAIDPVIGKLRRLSEIDAGAFFTIETIARVGYRLHRTGGCSPHHAPVVRGSILWGMLKAWVRNCDGGVDF